MENMKSFKNFMCMNSQLDDYLEIEFAYPNLPSPGGWWSERQMLNSGSLDVYWYDFGVLKMKFESTYCYWTVATKMLKFDLYSCLKTWKLKNDKSYGW